MGGDEAVARACVDLIASLAGEGNFSGLRRYPKSAHIWLAELEKQSMESPVHDGLSALEVGTWAELVGKECEALDALIVICDGRVDDATFERLIRLLPVATTLRTLRRLHVPRDLMTRGRATAFRAAVEDMTAARSRYLDADDNAPDSRVKKSAYALDLPQDIRDLRDNGGWLPWDKHTSDAALKRVRPHFRAGHQLRSRHELANDLELVEAVVTATAHLELAERRHGAALAPIYKGVDEGWLVVGRVAEGLGVLYDEPVSHAATPADLDAAWALPRAQLLSPRLWQTVEVMAAIRTNRRTSSAQRRLPSLALLDARVLSSLNRTQRVAWANEVVRRRSLLMEVSHDTQVRADAQAALGLTQGSESAEVGALRIQDGFRRARLAHRGSDNLGAAVAAAVHASLDAFARLEDELNHILDRTRPEDTEARTVWDREVLELQAAVRRRAEQLGTFRVVIFGRTGAGKSSFVEALTHGDGSSISPGENDFTKLCRPVQWDACTLVDTPGIEGWGRETSTADLEREAREALDTADLVLLAFDTSNQKVGEFEKVSRWVLEFDKPAIALLNVLNSQWRRPDKEPDLEVRRGHAQNVREHAQHIADSLAVYGLTETLPIAIRAVDAVAARCPDYRGPHQASVRMLRQSLGPDMLEWISHLEVVENLLIEALNSSAIELRLQSLSNDMRRRLKSLSVAIAQRADVARTEACACEDRIDAVLGVVGAGAPSDQERLDRQWRRGTVFGQPDGTDLLTVLEQLRERPFAAESMYGRVWDAWDDQCVLNLDVVAVRAAGGLESRIRDAFAEGERLTSKDMTALYMAAGKEMAAGANRAVQAVHEDLTLELSAVARELSAKVLTADARPERGLDATRGTGARNASRALTVASAVLIALPIPGANLLVAAVARAVGQILLSLFSRRSRDAAEKARAEELQQALRDARNILMGLREELAEHAARQVRQWAAEIASTVEGDVRRALAARETATQCESAATVLEALLEAMPLEGAGSRALAAARERITSVANFGLPVTATWTALALGEDWIDLGPASNTRVVTGPPDPLPREFVTPFDSLRESLLVMPVPSAIEVNSYLSGLHEIQSTASAGELSTSPGPDGVFTVALTGPSRVGVSGLVEAVASQLTETFADQVRLVDGSGSRDALACADVVGLVVPPSLFGAADDLDQFLGPQALLADTRRRMFIVLNRVDELAADPHEDPAQLASAVLRKLAEVSRFAERNDLPQGLAVVPVAAAPAGQPCPATPPWWSGVDRLATALSAAALQRDGWTGRLRRAVDHLDAQVDALTLQVGTLLVREDNVETLLSSIDRGVRRGVQLDAHLPALLTRSLERIVMPLAYDLAGAPTKEHLKKAQEELEGWRARPATDKAMAAFEETAVPKIEEWLAGLGRTLTWQPNSPAEEGPARSGSGSGNKVLGEVGRAATTLTKSAIKIATRLGSHDKFYKLGKDLGVKFKPWQAVKGAQRLRNASPALASLGIGLAALELWNSERAEKGRNKLRHDAPSAARADIATIVQARLQGTAEEPGLLAFTQTARAELDAERADTNVRLADIRAAREALESELATLTTARNDGLYLLMKEVIS